MSFLNWKGLSPPRRVDSGEVLFGLFGDVGRVTPAVAGGIESFTPQSPPSFGHLIM